MRGRLSGDVYDFAVGGGLAAGVIVAVWLSGWAMPTKVLVSVGVIAGLLVLRWIARRGGATHQNADDGEANMLRNGLRSAVRRRSSGRLFEMLPYGLDEQLEVALTPRPRAARDPALRSVDVDDDADLATAFQQSGRRLLLLGDKGSGKTFALYQLLRDLTGAFDDVILVDASGWRSTGDPVDSLTAYAEQSYKAEPEQFRQWVRDRQPILVVDGLDELGSSRDHAALDQRRALIAELRQWGDVPERGLLLACRSEDWAALDVIAPTTHAVEIEPLADSAVEQVCEALVRIDPDWSRARPGTTPHEALRSPLFASLAIGGHVMHADVDQASIEDARLAISERYLDHALSNARHRARQYLEWIASFLAGSTTSAWGHHSPDSTVFTAAALTPNKPPVLYRTVGGLVDGLVVGLVFRLVVGLVGGLVFGLVFGLVGGLVVDAWPTKVTVALRPQRLAQDLREQLVGGLVVGLVGGLAFGLVGGLVFGLVFGLDANIRSPSVISDGDTFDTALRESLKSWLAVGLAVGLAFGLAFGPAVGLAVGLAGGLVFGPAVGLAGGPAVGLAGGLVVGLVFGLVYGLFVGLGDGGWFVVLQRVARRRLIRAGHLPTDLAVFCDEMVAAGTMRPTGLGYRFRHDELQRALTRVVHTEASP